MILDLTSLRIEEFIVIRITNEALTSVMQHYAKYFIEDFTAKTMSHLKASCSVDEDRIADIISKKIESLTDNIRIDLNNNNPAMRFVCECAMYALENDFRDPTDRKIYNEISILPSRYHEKIDELSFSAAQLYDLTLEKTVCGIIARDASDISSLIRNDITERLSKQNTGGNLKTFSWGILDSGSWLNNTLEFVHSKSGIFKSGSSADLSWVRTSFDLAERNTEIKSYSGMDRHEISSYIELLFANCDDIENNASEDQVTKLKNMMSSSGSLRFALEDYRKAMDDPRAVVESVRDLSSYAMVVNTLKTTATNLGDEVIPAVFVENLDKIDNFTKSSLAAFEALREVKYKDTLIMFVDPNPNGDPTVDVFVNKDNVNRFHYSGGTDDELMQIGSYLDPRRGMQTPSSGWNIDQIEKNKIDIISSVIANEQNMQRELRANDAKVIRSVVSSRLLEVANSYNIACNRKTLSEPVQSKINDISQDVVSKTTSSDYSMETEVAKLLCDVMDNPFVSRTTSLFVEAINSQDESIKKEAKALTFAGVALHDASLFFA